LKLNTQEVDYLEKQKIMQLRDKTPDLADETPLWSSVLQKYFTETHRENTEEHREILIVMFFRIGVTGI